MPVRQMLHRHFNVLLTDELDLNVAVLGGEVQLVGGICILLQGVLAEEDEVLVAGVGDADLYRRLRQDQKP